MKDNTKRRLERIHDYEDIDITRVFDITQEPIGQLIQNLEALLKI